jgi:cobalt-precorrin-7 (C5)-methyltransferase
MAKTIRISIVGVGPGNPDFVTPIARRTVQQAQVVIGAQRAIELFGSDIKGEAIKLTAKNMSDTLNKAVELAQKGKTVAILSTGDPGFSGMLKTYLKFTNGKDVVAEVIPGISSIQVCAARLALPWDKIRLFTFHEGITNKEKETLLQTIKNGGAVMFLPETKNFSPELVAKSLINGGIDPDTPAFVCENLTLNDEKVFRSTLREVSKVSFGSLCVMVIKPNP